MCNKHLLTYLLDEPHDIMQWQRLDDGPVNSVLWIITITAIINTLNVVQFITVARIR